MEHLDRTGELFSRYGAKLYLNLGRAKKRILKLLLGLTPERAVA